MYAYKARLLDYKVNISSIYVTIEPFELVMLFMQNKSFK